MAEKETVNKPKDLVEATPEEMEKMDKENASVAEIVEDAEKVGEVAEPEKELTWAEKREARQKKEDAEKLVNWVPKTQIGRDVKEGKEKDI